MKILKDYASTIIMLCIAAVVWVLVCCGVLDLNRIIESVRNKKMLAFFVIMALFLLKGCSLSIPHGVVLVGCALIFDLVPAVIINIFGTILCVSASYIIGRFSKKLTFESIIKKYPRMERCFSNVEREGFLTSYVIHSLHMPTEVQGLLFGLLRTPYAAYLSSSMIALLPSMLCYTVLGSSWDLKNPLLWLFLALDAAAVATGLFFAKRRIIDK